VIVGDSLTSDIRGGKNAGILTCWYNPDHLPNKIEVTPDCTIDNLQDILSYLDESR
jgi:FMN phosphatase YigB (HAD superfamily)